MPWVGKAKWTKIRIFSVRRWHVPSSLPRPFLFPIMILKINPLLSWILKTPSISHNVCRKIGRSIKVCISIAMIFWDEVRICFVRDHAQVLDKLWGSLKMNFNPISILRISITFYIQTERLINLWKFCNFSFKSNAFRVKIHESNLWDWLSHAKQILVMFS